MDSSKLTNLLIGFFVLLYSSSLAQVDLYVEGGDGLIMHVNEVLIVQAEGNVSIDSVAVMSFGSIAHPDFRLRGDFTNHTSGIYTLGTEKIRFNGSTLQYADFGGDEVLLHG